MVEEGKGPAQYDMVVCSFSTLIVVFTIIILYVGACVCFCYRRVQQRRNEPFIPMEIYLFLCFYFSFFFHILC